MATLRVEYPKWWYGPEPTELASVICMSLHNDTDTHLLTRGLAHVVQKLVENGTLSVGDIGYLIPGGVKVFVDE